MRMKIRKSNLQWSEALAAYAEERLQQRLERVRDRVRSVFVRLADVNGPRGGSDKHCLVSVRLIGGREIVVRGEGVCPYRAVDDVASRLIRTVTERLRRERSLRRKFAR